MCPDSEVTGASPVNRNPSFECSLHQSDLYLRPENRLWRTGSGGWSPFSTAPRAVPRAEGQSQSSHRLRLGSATVTSCEVNIATDTSTLPGRWAVSWVECEVVSRSSFQRSCLGREDNRAVGGVRWGLPETSRQRGRKSRSDDWTSSPGFREQKSLHRVLPQRVRQPSEVALANPTLAHFQARPFF